MTQVKGDLGRGSLFPDARPSAADTSGGLSALAIIKADDAIAKLQAEGLTVELHQDRLRVSGPRPSRDARALIERAGDFIEARLRMPE
jgi:hypothetical protein